jgi:hypothetical protein
MSAHTSIPWRATDPDDSYHDVIRIYGLGGSDIPVAICPQMNSPGIEVLCGSNNKTTEAALNAAFIVEAVNNHEKLLARVEKLEKSMSEAIQFIYNSDIEDAALLLEAALKEQP